MSLRGPIIAIDDDDDDHYLMQQIIKELPITNEVRSFFNGRDALDYLERTDEKPFVILCDINMPIMNGLELRHRISESEYLRKKSIPFIFLTTDASPNLIQDAYDADVQGFYRKAADYTGLRQQLQLIFDYWQSCLHPNNQP